ncbi:MAG: SPOR domain-containing protein [Alphaproteobacteria bacterium]|nr:SPOR domain-containing protein [Alphaproteobacteria bacterium]
MDEENLNSFREERLNLKQRKPIIFTSVFLGTILAIVVGVSTFGKYITFSSGKNLEELPVIKADSNSYGFVPANPGGLDVPNRDKYIYESLRNKNFKEVERLLEPTEKPTLSGDFKKLTENDNDKLLKKSESSKQQVEMLFKEDVKIQKNEKIVLDKKVLKEEESSKKIEGKEVKTKKEKNSELFYIQFASVRSKEMADAEVKRLEKKYIDLFKNLKLEISEIETEKGAFFRIRTESFTDRENAKKMCQKFKDKKQECIIVK